MWPTGGNSALAQEADHGLATLVENLGCIHCECDEMGRSSGWSSAMAVAFSQTIAEIEVVTSDVSWQVSQWE
jgi:hypothetical protein